MAHPAARCARERSPWSRSSCRPRRAEQHAAALAAVQRRLHALGITAWQDASVYDAERLCAPAGGLSCRGAGRQPAGASGGRPLLGSAPWLEQVEGFLEQAASASIGRLRAGTVKIWVDGVIEGLTAAMLDPYLDEHGRATDDRGMALVPPEPLREAVIALDRAGLQVHIHAIGDAAVRSALDAIEAARRANGPIRPSPSHRAHPAHPPVRPAAIRRPGRDGQHAADLGLPRADDGRSARSRSWDRSGRAGNTRSPASLRHGARLAAGSDWPVTTRQPAARDRGQHDAGQRARALGPSPSFPASASAWTRRWPRSPSAPRT